MTESISKTKFDANRIRWNVNAYFLWRTAREKDYKVKERDQIKTVLAMTVDLSMACKTKIQFIFQNRQVLTRKKLFVLLLMQLQVSDLFVFKSYSSILFLELGRMRNGVLYSMDPYA